MKKAILRGSVSTMVIAGMLAFTGCNSGYSVVSVEGGRFPITEAYEQNADAEAVEILRPYKQKVDSMMKPVIGYAAKTLHVARPESPLSNLIADVLRESARNVLNRPADVAVMNMGGIRNSLPEGKITFGTIYEIAPFENTLCIVTMDGNTLQELLAQIAAVGGEGLSGAKLVADAQTRKLLKAEVGGKPVDPEKTYTIATIDYLAEGNDKLAAFRKIKSKTIPRDMLLRDLLMRYVKQSNEQQKVIDARTEGRIVFKQDK